MRFDLNAMALFVGVVEHKSFSEASKRLGVPVSTVSRKVAELEKVLGVRLLERSTRQLRLSGLGREFYDYCRRGLAELEAGALKINDRQEEVSGTLRISAPPNIADVLLAPALCAFQTRYPKVRSKVQMTERNVNLIEDEVDIALRVGPLGDSSLVARRLLSYRHVLVASPEYINAKGMPEKPDELHAHRLISFEGWQSEVFWRLSNNRSNRKKESTKIKVNAVLSMNDFAGIEYAVNAGLGIANMPALLCAELLQKGKLVEVLPRWQLVPITFYAVYPSNHHMLRTARLFVDFLVDYLQENKRMQEIQSI